MARAWFQSVFKQLSGNVTAIAVLCCASLVAFDAVELSLGRQERLDAAGREVTNLSASLAQYCQQAIETADTALIGLRDEATHYGVDAAHLPVLQGLMFRQLANLPTLHGLFLYDAQGRWLINTVPGTPPELTYADRDYFQFHLHNAADIAFVGPPIRSRADQSWIITITRRLSRDDGSFGGVIDATISAELFQTLFNRFDIGPHGTITLTDAKGDIFVRAPYAERNVGRNIAETQAFRTAAATPDGRMFHFVSPGDQDREIGAAARVGGTSLRVMVARSETDILAPWWREARINLLCLAIIVSAALLLSRRVSAELRDRARAEGMYRLLADNSEDAIVAGALDGHAHYVSPSLAVIAGWPVEDLLGVGWMQHVPSEDRAAIQAALAGLIEGRAHAAARFRYRRPDGGTVWVELRARRTASSTVGGSDFVANLRDISLQRRAEEALEDANSELSALSITDALTGVANRRHFDQMLKREWNRAMRTASPVGLLMIDTDHFKAYNDHFGHPMGDQCLREVAKAIASAVLRAGDLVTRYGGEEFAVILPDTIAESAAQVAERVLGTLVDRAIAHPASARGVVTVSIGVASAIPALGSTPADLLEQADLAVYRAKSAGRARVEIAPPRVAA